MNLQVQTALDPQVVISVSELLDGWCPQHFLAERMIIMVPHVRSKVLTFLLHGRNSGQSGTRSVDALRAVNGYVFGNGGMLVSPSNWIRSAEKAASSISPGLTRTRVTTLRTGPARFSWLTAEARIR
jgi:hypothetical protein